MLDRCSERDLLLACGALIAVLYGLIAAHGLSYVSTGDEPHYMLDALSLARDGDRDLVNQYSDPTQVSGVYDGPLTPDTQAYMYGGDSALRSTHAAGLGVLLVPAAALDLGVGGARATMTLVSVAAAILLLSVLLRTALAPRWALLCAWLATVLSLPVASYVDQVYPEVPGLLLGLAAVRVLVSQRPPAWALALASSCATGLPWLNARFAPLSLMLIVALAVRTWGDRRPRTALALVRSAWPLVIPAALNTVAFLVLNHRWYASLRPSAPYEPLPFYTDETSAPRVYDQIVGNLLSPIYGWLPQAPVHLLGLAGLGLLVSRRPRWGTFGITAVAVYVLVVGTSGIGSVAYAFPARLHLVVIPLVALPLALVLVRSRVLVVAFGILSLASGVLCLQALQDRGRLIPTDLVTGEGALAMSSSRNLAPMWPDFRRPVPSSFTFASSVLPRTVGALAAGTQGPVTAVRAREGEGYAAFGPYKVLAEGRWRAVFRIARGQAPPGQVVADIDVASGQVGSATALVMAARSLTTEDLPGDASFATFELPFVVSGAEQVQTRVHVLGRADLQSGAVDIIYQPDPFASDLARDFPDLALSAAWLSGVVLLGALVATRRPDEVPLPPRTTAAPVSAGDEPGDRLPSTLGR